MTQDVRKMEMVGSEDGVTRRLSQAQLTALDLFLAGATDQYVAETVGRHRVTVTGWRLYNPHFRTELVRRRRAAFGGAVEAMRSVIPLALDTLREQLRVGSSRGQIAVNVLHKAGLMAAPLMTAADVTVAEDEETILAEILDAEVRRRRAAIRAEDPEDELGADPGGPVSEDEREAALQHLLSLGPDLEEGEERAG